MKSKLASSVAINDCSKISLKSIDSYLTGRDWRVKTGVGRGLVKVYECDGDKSKQVSFPAIVDLDNYAEMVSRGIDTVAEYEGRSPVSLFNDLVFYFDDVFELREVVADDANGTISFERASCMFSGIKSSIYSAALLEIKPRLYDPRPKRTDADNFIKLCRFGHTKPGSYIMTVSCPLSAMTKPALNRIDLFESTFARRITKRLYLAVDLVSKSAADGNPEAILNRDPEQDLISANLCDALVKLIPDSEGSRIEVGVRWAKKLPLDSATETIRYVPLKNEYIPFIQSVSTELKSRSDSGTADFFVGSLADLRGKEFKDGTRFGDVTLKLESEKTHERFTAKIHLNREDHAKAIAAYSREHIIITVRGILKRGAGGVRIESYSDFKTIEG